MAENTPVGDGTDGQPWYDTGARVFRRVLPSAAEAPAGVNPAEHPELVRARPGSDAGLWIVWDEATGRRWVLDDMAFHSDYQLFNPFEAAGQSDSALDEVHALSSPRLAVLRDRHPIQRRDVSVAERAERLVPGEDPHLLIVARGGRRRLDGWAGANAQELLELDTLTDALRALATDQGKVLVAFGNDSASGLDGKNPRQEVQAAHEHCVFVDPADMRGLQYFIDQVQKRPPQDCQFVSSFTDIAQMQRRQAAGHGRPPGLDGRGDYCYMRVPPDPQKFGAAAGRILVMDPLGPTQSAFNIALGAALGVSVGPDERLAHTRGLDRNDRRRAPVMAVVKEAGPDRPDPAIVGITERFLTRHPWIASAIADATSPDANLLWDTARAQTLDPTLKVLDPPPSPAVRLAWAKVRADALGRHEPPPPLVSDADWAHTLEGAQQLRKTARMFRFRSTDAAQLSVTTAAGKTLTVEGAGWLALSAHGTEPITTAAMWTDAKFEAANRASDGAQPVREITLPPDAEVVDAQGRGPRSVRFPQVSGGVRGWTSFTIPDGWDVRTVGARVALIALDGTPGADVFERALDLKLAVWRGPRTAMRTSEGLVMVEPNALVAISVDRDGKPVQINEHGMTVNDGSGYYDIYCPDSAVLANYETVTGTGTTPVSALTAVSGIGARATPLLTTFNLAGTALYRSTGLCLITPAGPGVTTYLPEGGGVTPRHHVLEKQAVTVDGSGTVTLLSPATPLDPELQDEYTIVAPPQELHRPDGQPILEGTHLATHTDVVASAVYLGPDTYIRARYGFEVVRTGDRIAQHMVRVGGRLVPRLFKDEENVPHPDQYPISARARDATQHLLEVDGHAVPQFGRLRYHRSSPPALPGRLAQLGRVPVILEPGGGVTWMRRGEVERRLARINLRLDQSDLAGPGRTDRGRVGRHGPPPTPGPAATQLVA